uniref:short-chain dehydrogenase TIC 32 B, chloroplastic-like isoform X2 n=1 Tax=Erigeron canadensis TaxID=72917 RepID=UPI001CB902CB|nr:short-chain dehydrogenase TIC 32 B, chloroplastic-like isoform X2 [Erigeron canadensis]
MIEMIKYLIGFPGPSGYGSKSTADQVVTTTTTADIDSCRHAHDDEYSSSCTAIITGGTSGIGAETARVLAKRGVRLVLPTRNLKSGEEIKARILSEFPKSDIILMTLDLSSLGSVRNFVSDFQALHLPLTLLINNAGKYCHHHCVSEDGIEMTFATNYLGHFLLTKLLLKNMIETAKITGVQGRIVNVTSAIHTWVSGDFISSLGRERTGPDKSQYDATRAYAISKVANILHTKELARKLQQMEANVIVNCVHPGVVRTGLLRDHQGFITDLIFFLASKLLKTVPQAAATTCYVATHSRLKNMSGKYFVDCNEASPSKLACNPDEGARLWSLSEIMVDFRS